MSVRLFRKPKIEITVNGSGIDNPNSGTIHKQRDIWTASLSYPNQSGRMFEYFQPQDVVRIYLGLDIVPDVPTFTGVSTQDEGENLKSFSFLGRLYAMQKESVIIDDLNFNLDGYEVSMAIRKLLEVTSFPLTRNFHGTQPSVHVPSSFRYDKGENVYTVIKALRDMAVDTSDYSHLPLYYFLYEENDRLFFRKEPELIDANSWFTLTGGDNLLNGIPESKTYGIINKQTVIGKDGVTATYESSHRMATDGVFAGKIIVDETLLTASECYYRARLEVENNKVKTVNTQITALEMIDSIPNLTIVKILNAKNIISGLHRVRDIDMTFGKGFSISTQIEKDVPVFGKEVSLLLPQ